MADIFLKADVRKLLERKTVVFMGDSNMRALYKDIIFLICEDKLISQNALKAKLEPSFCGDELRRRSELHNGRHFYEERVFTKGGESAPKISFYFITRCFSDKVIGCLRDAVTTASPDVVVFNSCLWDITRYGHDGVMAYKKNLYKLMGLLRTILPKHCLFIWCTTLPVSQEIKGGFLIKQVDFLKHTLRFEVAEANLYASKVVSESGYDVLDLHYYLRYQIHRRADDGVHWFPASMRHITNLLLTHLSLAWDRPLPGRFTSRILDCITNLDEDAPKQPKSIIDQRNAEDRHVVFRESAWLGQGFYNFGSEVPNQAGYNTSIGPPPPSRCNDRSISCKQRHVRFYEPHSWQPTPEQFQHSDSVPNNDRSRLFYMDFTSDIVPPYNNFEAPSFTANTCRQEQTPLQRPQQPIGDNHNHNPFDSFRSGGKGRNPQIKNARRGFNKNRQIGRWKRHKNRVAAMRKQQIG